MTVAKDFVSGTATGTLRGSIGPEREADLASVRGLAEAASENATRSIMKAAEVLPPTSLARPHRLRKALMLAGIASVVLGGIIFLRQRWSSKQPAGRQDGQPNPEELKELQRSVGETRWGDLSSIPNQPESRMAAS